MQHISSSCAASGSSGKRSDFNCVRWSANILWRSRYSAKPVLPKQSDPAHRRFSPRFGSGSAPITHVVIIIQENRTVDNLFNSLPGADTAQTGLNSSGGTVPSCRSR